MRKDASFNLRLTSEQKANIAARAVAAGCVTLSDYVLQVLFVHDNGLELREMLKAALEEMIAARSDIVMELDKARADWLEGVNQLMADSQAGKGAILAALGNKPEKKDFASIFAKLQQESKSKNPVQDPLLYPAGLIIAFLGGVVFF